MQEDLPSSRNDIHRIKGGNINRLINRLLFCHDVLSKVNDRNLLRKWESRQILG